MTDTLRTFEGAVAIVTGGASGIGKSLGEELATRGCEVVLADRDLAGAQAVASSIASAGGTATAAALDVTDADALESLVTSTAQRCGRLDYMFNNAGIALNGRFEDFGLEHWERIVSVNFMGVVHGTRAAQRCMAAQGFGHIINTASFAGVFPWPTTIPYTASKHAVVGLSTALRAELAGSGVHVSVLCPGTVMTPMIEKGASPERWVGEYSSDRLAAFFKDARGMAPEKFARAAVNAVARRRAVIVLPAAYKGLWWLNRLSPSLAIGLGSKIYGAILDRVSD